MSKLRIRCRARGPLVVDGDLGELELHGPDGEPIDLTDRPRILLCRCGASKSRPFCDGSHHRTDFEADE
ncbi:MAG TPA: CDGSH iron-sulfur domain-containing protein [Polyangiaceae bacterium LLY-WYZ-15_(1-7)]|nr:iron-binding protein [Myxococcales bacterium]MAT26905.1 iron-binding protein [Sandaracinus sp.]HJK91343.1 CDGSH iron-sulfur domain-containing protein [Polyangiaceae bacterium LLY-WYZ-15_(1-7)]MBJ70212.1 iron-binding protein [Sandaracinus sp.]HJL03108.1 CDGSH iron-sulfur domain-containing protein [Polyangiaceae bacterium LLY-WYZ-15_(1-7)]